MKKIISFSLLAFVLGLGVGYFIFKQKTFDSKDCIKRKDIKEIWAIDCIRNHPSIKSGDTVSFEFHNDRGEGIYLMCQPLILTKEVLEEDPDRIYTHVILK